MVRIRAFVALLLLAFSVCAFATDYRLVIASDDPNTRKAPAIVVYEATGKLSKDDRITSITFSAGADVRANCLVSLDPAAGKTDLAMSPDVQVYSGKVMLAGAKPTRKVIPANLSIDVPIASGKENGKLSALVQPIIHQVYNLPWGYIGIGVGIVLAAMFLMNRRSQAYTTSMSKEAKSLYLETVKSIVDRLDKIETSQHNLVKNPPVARAFRAQIEGFEARLNRIEKLAKESQDHLAKASGDLAHSGERQEAALSKIDALKEEGAQSRSALTREVESLKTDLGQFAKTQIAMREDLGAFEDLKAAATRSMEQLQALEAKLQEAEVRAQSAEVKAVEQVAALRNEVQAMQAELSALSAMPAQVEAVHAGIAAMPDRFEAIQTSLEAIPSEFESVRASMPDLNQVEARLEALSGLEDKLTALPEIQSGVESMPARLEDLSSNLEKVHESILRQIGELTGQVDDSREALSELMSAHSFSEPIPEPASAENEAFEEPPKEVAPEENVTEMEAMPEPIVEEPEAEAEEPVSETFEFEENAVDLDLPEAYAELPQVEMLDPVEVAVQAVEEAEEPEMAEPEVVEEHETSGEEAPAEEPMPEFHFDNEVNRLASRVEDEQPALEDNAMPEPVTFKLDPLPDHLDTFEDGAEEVLSAFHEEDFPEAADDEEVDDVLIQLFAEKPTEEAAIEEAEFEMEELPDSKTGLWLAEGGSSAKTWSANCSRTPELAAFEGDLKPMTPIGTAPIGAMIGASLYAFGRIVYSCGQAIHGFWPGREDRSFALDHEIPLDAWRLAAKGQNLFVVEKNRVKILSLQGWFALEQFSGEYRDQLVTDDQWIGVRQSAEATLDFRDHRGQTIAEGVQLHAGAEGLRLCSDSKQAYAGTADGRILEVSPHGFEELGTGPQGGSLLHLCVYQGAPLALFSSESGIECRHFASSAKGCSLDIAEVGGAPVLMGHKLYLADLQKSELLCVNLKKMQVSSVACFEGVSTIRRMIGVYHGSHQMLFAVLSGSGKSSCKLSLIDPKTGKEMRLCSANQSKIDLICADHHVVLASSCEYQNVIRVMEPFVEQRVAA